MNPKWTMVFIQDGKTTKRFYSEEVATATSKLDETYKNL